MTNHEKHDLILLSNTFNSDRNLTGLILIGLEMAFTAV